MIYYYFFNSMIQSLNEDSYKHNKPTHKHLNKSNQALNNISWIWFFNFFFFFFLIYSFIICGCLNVQGRATRWPAGIPSSKERISKKMTRNYSGRVKANTNRCLDLYIRYVIHAIDVEFIHSIIYYVAISSFYLCYLFIWRLTFIKLARYHVMMNRTLFWC